MHIFFLKQKSLLVVPSTNFYGENNAVTFVVTVLATAMHGLHLERFMEEMDIPLTTLLQELENLQDMIIQ